MDSAEERLRAIIRAWDKLPKGHHSPDTVQNWLIDDLGPAIVEAKKFLEK